MTHLSRKPGQAYPEEPAPWVDPEYWQQKQEAQAQYYLELDAQRARWKLAQLHAAGVHPAEVTFDAGRMKLGPLSPAEYQIAWDAMRAQHSPRERRVELLWNGLLIAIIAAGILWGGTAVAVTVGLLALPIMAVVCLVMVISDARSMTASARLGRRHPNPYIREWAKKVWWMPGAGAIVLAIFILIVFGGMAWLWLWGPLGGGM